MIRKRQEWYDWCMEYGTRDDFVWDILKDWKEDQQQYIDADGFFEEFLAMQKHARTQHDSTHHDERMYWQGVKDGLRKLWSIVTNEPLWRKVGQSSISERPESAGGEYP